MADDEEAAMAGAVGVADNLKAATAGVEIIIRRTFEPVIQREK